MLTLALGGCGPEGALPAAGSDPGRAILTRSAKNPMALAVAPPGNVYFIERTGEVRLLDARTGAVTDALVLSVDAGHEGGLLGLALDPAFSSNGFVYLYFSAPLAAPLPASGPPGLNVLARYTAFSDGSLDPRSRHDLLVVPSERRCCHEGGSLAFAPDGTLFLGTGDNTNPFASIPVHRPIDLDVGPDGARSTSSSTAAATGATTSTLPSAASSRDRATRRSATSPRRPRSALRRSTFASMPVRRARSARARR